ncbi:MAG: IPT/TIG domain-containing protein [Myxococcales bacterium]|nr:IPT/TIG domain-containing protein [Myxococcales bacterium]
MFDPIRRWALVALAAAAAAGCSVQIDAVTPDPAIPGAPITITGFNFDKAEGRVLYDGAPLAVESWHFDKIVATLPADAAPGAHTVQVETGFFDLFASQEVAHHVEAPCANGAAPIHVVWDRLDPVSLPPSPSDYFTVPAATATGRRVHIVPGENLPLEDNLSRLFPNVIDELNTLDGFGTSSPALVPLTGPVDLDSNGGHPLFTASPERHQRHVFDAADAPIFFLNIDPGSPRYGERRAVIVDHLENDFLVIEPLRVLDGATRYALILSKSLLGADEGAGPRCVQPSAAWQRLLDGGPDLTPDEQDLFEFVFAALGQVAFADPTIALGDLALAMPFTTQTTYDELLEVRADLMATPEPEIVPGSLTVETLASGSVAYRVHGKFTAPDWRGAERLWERDPGTGHFLQKGVLERDFVLHVPRENGEYAQPYPIAIYLHGLAGDLGESNTAGERLATQGIATIATAAVGHDSGVAVIAVFEFFNLLDIATGAPNAFSVIRDNFRQSTIDQIQLLRLARRLAAEGFDAAPPIGVPDLDPSTPMGELGVSLGGLMGGTLAAVEPTIESAVLFVGGGVVSKLIQDSPLFSFLIPIFQLILAPGEPLTPDSVPSFFALMQTVLEKGDPVNYARHVFEDPLVTELPGIGPKNMMLVQVVPDLIVPNSSNEAYARAFGLPLLETKVAPVEGLPLEATPAQDNVAPGVTAGFFQYDDYRENEGGPLVPADHTTVGGAFEPFLQGATFARSFLENRLAGNGHGGVLIDPFDPVQVDLYGVDTSGN